MRERRKGGLEGLPVGDLGESGAERLGCAEQEVTLPFAGTPEGAAGIGGFASFRGDEMDRVDAQRGGFLQDFPCCLGTGQPDDQGDGIKGRRGIFPDIGENQVIAFDILEGRFAARAVDDTDIESIAGLASEDFENVIGSWIREGERMIDFCRLKEDDIQRWGWIVDCRGRGAT